jgi:hypothetical protein
MLVSLERTPRPAHGRAPLTRQDALGTLTTRASVQHVRTQRNTVGRMGARAELRANARIVGVRAHSTPR